MIVASNRSCVVLCGVFLCLWGAEASVVSVVQGDCWAQIEIESEFPVRESLGEWGAPSWHLFTTLTPSEGSGH